MHGKAQCELARSLTNANQALEICVDNLANMIKLIMYYRKREPADRTARKCWGDGQKLANRSQPFVDQSSPNTGACNGVSVYCRVSFRLSIPCSVAEMFSVKFKVGLKKRFFSFQPVGVNARDTSDQMFQIAVIREFVQAWLRSVQWPPRLGVENRRMK